MFNPDDATLNLRSEFFAHCRHKDRHLWSNRDTFEIFYVILNLCYLSF